MVRFQDLRVHAPLLIAEGACFIFVCSVMVVLRFYARKISGSRYGLDDYAVLAALVCVITQGVTIITETAVKGLGYPASVGDAGPGHPDSNYAGWPTELIQIPALGCIKLSFLFLYGRVFTTRVVRRFSWVNRCMIAIIIAWTITFFFLILFLCRTNFAAYWTSSTTEANECLPTTPVHLSYAISDVITDILTILLPIPEIWKLHLPVRRKIAVTGVFGLGIITIVMSIIRLVIYHGALTVQFDPDTDFEFINTLTSYFSFLEAGLGLCASCLPVQYGLLHSEKFRNVLRSIYSLGSLDSHGSGNSHGSRRSQFSRRSRVRSIRLHDMPRDNTNGSQASETEIPLPNHAAAAAGFNLTQSELDNKNSQDVQGIMVTRSFEMERGEV